MQVLKGEDAGLEILLKLRKDSWIKWIYLNMNPSQASFPHPSLRSQEHRPWPRPQRPWMMRQEWRDLLFLHVEVSPDSIRDRIPKELELDLFEGKAWLGLVPFDMKGVTLRGCPAPSSLCDFPELNIRTYVLRDGKPGVWFFSLDVPKAHAVWGARTFFHLPYFKAEMAVTHEGDWIRMRHQRPDRSLDIRYRGMEEVEALPGSFARWSTERYCLYCQSKAGRVYRGEIHHAPWPLQRAEVEMEHEEMFGPFEIGDRHPETYLSPSIHVVVYPLESLS